MKKKILFLFFAMSAGILMAEKEDAGDGTTPANPYTVCLSDPGNNTGHCKERVDGMGSSCVKAGLFQSKNCYDAIPKP